MNNLNQNISWIDASWLKSHLEEVTILDVQPDIHDYIMEHIPGAVYFNENHLRFFHHKLPSHYIPAQCLQQFLQSAGLQKDKTAVIYGSHGRFSKKGDGLEQSMMAYTLARFGHPDILVLNGGLKSWIDAGYPLTKEYPTISVSEYNLSLNSDLFFNYNQFIEIKDSPDTALIDVRPRSVYQGSGLWEKSGHIPGAKNLPWRLLMDPDNPYLLRSKPTISELAISRGASPDKNVILYCGTGREATSAFLVFKYFLNYPHVKLYEGSFTEWVSYPQNPTVTGPKPY